MIRGKDNIVAWFDMNAETGAIHWKICNDKNANKVIFTSGSDSTEDGDKGTSISSDYSRRRFMDAVNLLDPGNYTLINKKYLGQGKGTYETLFHIPREEAFSRPANIKGLDDEAEDPMLGIEGMIQTRVETALGKYKLELENDQLKRQVEELQKHSKTTASERRMDKFIEAITPHVGSIIGSITGKPAPAITGTDLPPSKPIRNPDSQNTDQDRFVKACDTLNRHTPDLVGALEQLADMAEKEPDKFQMALSILTNK